MPRDNIALGFVPMGTKDKPYWHCPAHCPDRKTMCQQQKYQHRDKRDKVSN